MEEQLDITSAHRILPKEFVVFAGAGVVSDTGVPSTWSQLVKALALEADLPIDVTRLDPEEYAEKTEEIYQHLVSLNKGSRYFEIIREKLRPRVSTWSTAVFDILDMCMHIVTTNFDDVFERTYERYAELNPGRPAHPETHSLPDFTHDRPQNSHKIDYLHGRADEHHIVFKKSDYNTYYPSVSKTHGDPCLEEYLTHIYSTYTMVFVGFSFDDVYVRGCLRKAYQTLVERDARCSEKVGYRPAAARIAHYAFLRQPTEREEKKRAQREALWEDLAKMQIKVVPYKDHTDWQDCFKRMRNARKTVTKTDKADEPSIL